MAGEFQAPRGTADLLPVSEEAHRFVVETFRKITGRAGFRSIETPAFEDTALFQRGVGDSTDIVRKEMFTFEDKGGRSLTLRPEGTAPICRAYIEHGMSRLPQPVKLAYEGSFFRHERPQAGRFRQFHQVGVEVIGADSPLADAEVICLLDAFLGELEVPDLELHLGSLGSPEARKEYLSELTAYLESRESELSEDVRDRVGSNPLRAFDSDDEGTARVMEEAPLLLDRLDGEDREHFERVRELLDEAGVGYTVDPTLVRGLDYYGRTVFSFTCDRLGAQSEVGGGGRYDGLITRLGGPDSPAIGWAAGVERILLALDREGESPELDLFLAWTEESVASRIPALARELRDGGISVGFDLAERNLKGQLKQADRAGARWTAILAADGSAELKEMETGDQRAAELGELASIVAD
ncbi:MAG: histidine--tRNA ligase [Solirubrobacterales bacterium]